LKKELDIRGRVRTEWSGNREQKEPRRTASLDLLVDSGAVAMGTELLQFQPFGGVAAVLLGCVPRHTRRPLGGVGPAFGALKSDNDPDALVFGHGRTLRRESEA
jgi:hypothetical protein